MVRPYWFSNGRWRQKAPPKPWPLYRRDEIQDHDGIVWVVEGEPCAEAMRQIGLFATTSAFGAMNARCSDWSPIAHRDIVILPDNDDSGRQYSADVAAELFAINPEASIRVLDLPGLGEKEDVVDFIACRAKD